MKNSSRSRSIAAARGVQAAKSGQVDLVIMDVGLPDLDGREAVRILRKNGFKAPIIRNRGPVGARPSRSKGSTEGADG